DRVRRLRGPRPRKQALDPALRRLRRRRTRSLAGAPRAREALVLDRRRNRAPPVSAEPPLAGPPSLPDARGPGEREALRQERRALPRTVPEGADPLPSPAFPPDLGRRARVTPRRASVSCSLARLDVFDAARPHDRGQSEELLPGAHLPHALRGGRRRMGRLAGAPGVASASLAEG